MDKNYSKEDIRRININLTETSKELTKAYKEYNEHLEERYYRIKRMLDSGILNQNEVDFYQNQISGIYKSMEECDELKYETVGKINNAIENNEEEIARLQRLEEEAEEAEASEKDDEKEEK